MPSRHPKGRAFFTKQRMGTVLLFLGCMVFMFSSFTNFGTFLTWAEMRPGMTIDDPILSILPRGDVTWPVFAIIYTCIFGSVFIFMTNIPRFMLWMLAYGIVVYMRVITIYLFPLEPPPDLIILIDPVVEWWSSQTPFTKDLFFSGHTSSMVLLFFVARARWHKIIVGVGTVIVATLILVQRVHYSIDVLMAPFFTYAAYRLALWILVNKFKRNPNA